MLSAYCPDCGTEVLLSSRRIELVRNTEEGIDIVFRCWEGHRGTWHTGRAAAGAEPVVAA